MCVICGDGGYSSLNRAGRSDRMAAWSLASGKSYEPEPIGSQDSAAISRFERQAKAVAALSHTNILAIHDIGVEGETSYVVTELLEGETLRERICCSAIPWRRSTRGRIEDHGQPCAETEKARTKAQEAGGICMVSPDYPRL
jgi:serine/threonine protein kinase